MRGAQIERGQRIERAPRNRVVVVDREGCDRLGAHVLLVVVENWSGRPDKMLHSSICFFDGSACCCPLRAILTKEHINTVLLFKSTLQRLPRGSRVRGGEFALAHPRLVELVA